MKHPSICVFITMLLAFGALAVAQENRDPASPPSMSRQNTAGPQQGRGDGMMTNHGMMDRSAMDCSGCMVNRALARSSNFYLDMPKPLGLTDTQIHKLQQISLEFTKETADLRGELAIARLELQYLLEGDAIRTNDADRKISDFYDLEAELLIEKVKSIITARNVLTASQREQVMSLTRRDSMMPDMGGGQEPRY